MFIENQDDLVAFAERAAQAEVLAIDTEFLREKTFFAKLCLLQFNADGEVVIVDPLKVTDLTVLAPVMTNPNVMKLFHAASQDLEIIYREIGVLPSPIFDTQVAAALLGHVQQIGYAALVHSLCGVSLKKADSFTDWSRRPLTNSQLEYAADDVVYLPKMYWQMREQLSSKGRLDWLEPDFAEMINPERYQAQSRDRYRRLKRATQLNGRQLSAAREVAAWREDEAIRRNVPRKWILSDEQIVEACKREPRSIDQLFMVRGVRDHLSTRDARKVVALMEKGMDLPPEEWPELPKSARSERNVDSEVDLMMALARVRAKENDIAMQTFVSHDELVRLARGNTEGLDLLHGWRYKLIGRELQELLAGRLTLRLERGRLMVEPRGTESVSDSAETVGE